MHARDAVGLLSTGRIRFQSARRSHTIFRGFRKPSGRFPISKEMFDLFEGYSNRTDFTQLSNDEIRDKVAGSCSSYNKLIKPPRGALFGGGRSTDSVFKAASLNSFMDLLSATDLAKRFCKCLAVIPDQTVVDSVLVGGDPQKSCSCADPNQEQIDQAEAIMLDFELEIINFMKKQTNAYDTMQFTFFTTRSAEDLTKAAGSTDFFLIIIGYLVMIVFVSISAFNWRSRVTSRVGPAVVGVLLVILGLVASLGFASYIGLKYSPTITQVLPFLAVALGVDDMFVLLHSFRKHANPAAPAPSQTAKTMCVAG
eukprot:1002356_1